MREKILKFIFFVLGLLPILPFKLKSLGLIIGLVFGLYLIVKDDRLLSKFKKTYKNFLYGFLLFFLYVLSILLSNNKILQWKYIETSLSFFLFPVFFILISSDIDLKFWKSLEKIFYKTYFLSAVIYSFLIFAYIYHLGYFHHKVSYDFATSYLSGYFWGLSDHPIYSSMFLMIALFLNFKLLHYTEKRSRILLFLGSLFILSALIFLARKGVLLAGLIAILYFIFTSFDRKKLKYVFSIIVVSLGLATFIFPKTLSRFSEIFEKETYNQKVDLSRSTSIRYAIYKCSFEIGKNTGLFGVGMGDVQESLKKCFEKKYPVLAMKKLNTHNEYFNMWIGLGWLGLLYFLFYLYKLFKIALSAKDHFFVMILIFFTIIFLFENILDRQNGVLLFSLFVNLYLFKNISTT